MTTVVVLHCGHRLVRDYRVTSHLCLVARAFGAERIIIAGDMDKSIAKSVEGVVSRWGGSFAVEFAGNWRNALQEHRKRGYFVVHLTMYGLPLEKEVRRLRKQKKVILIVGSQKVDREVYSQSDLNMSITQQPHSEIAALAVALDGIFGGKERGKKFSNAKIRIIPAKNGKKVVKK